MVVGSAKQRRLNQIWVDNNTVVDTVKGARMNDGQQTALAGAGGYSSNTYIQRFQRRLYVCPKIPPSKKGTPRNRTPGQAMALAGP